MEAHLRKSALDSAYGGAARRGVRGAWRHPDEIEKRVPYSAKTANEKQKEKNSGKTPTGISFSQGRRWIRRRLNTAWGFGTLRDQKLVRKVGDSFSG